MPPACRRSRNGRSARGLFAFTDRRTALTALRTLPAGVRAETWADPECRWQGLQFVPQPAGLWGAGVGVLWAHSVNRTGARHRLADHLAGTAARARQFGEPFGA